MKRFRRLVEELVGYGLDESEIELLFQEQFSFMEWPDRIQTSRQCGEIMSWHGCSQMPSKSRWALKSQVISASEYESAAKYDALFVPIHLMSDFRSLRESLLVLPIVYDYDPDILLSMVDRAAIDTIGLVTGSEETIPKIIEELKGSVHFEGSFVAGTIYGKSLPVCSLRESDLVLIYLGKCTVG
ncbi:MAG: hypothetical protein U5K71_13225 [Gracilimonas sp.]|nr:hypothetical protein [Gracilimonas sp.]